MASVYQRVLEVTDYNDFRDKLATSGVFDMTDCSAKISCPLESDSSEIERMVKLLESMVHVTDVEVGSSVEDLSSEVYRVVIREEPSGPATRRKYRER